MDHSSTTASQLRRLIVVCVENISLAWYKARLAANNIDLVLSEGSDVKEKGILIATEIVSNVNISCEARGGKTGIVGRRIPRLTVLKTSVINIDVAWWARGQVEKKGEFGN